jgi:hypothetical protein
METSERKQRSNFRYTDALEVKARYILGTPLETLAEELAPRRGATVEQAYAYLVVIRARDGWIAQREQHLTAASALIEHRTIKDRASAIAKTQAEIGDRLLQIGLEELTTTKAVTRADALKTLEMGFQFNHRAAGLPDRIIDPALIPKGGGGIEGGRAEQLQAMNGEEVMSLIQRLVNNQVSDGTDSPQSRGEEESVSPENGE